MAHTPESLRLELENARKGGSQSEIADLALLVMNAERPKGAPRLDGASQAANRQSQRRYQRARTRDQNTARPSFRRKPAVGDYVRVPNGEVWLVTSLSGSYIKSDEQPGCLGYRSCPIAMCTIVDGPAAPAPASPPVPPTAPVDDVLYHACWDALEAQSWDALEVALRAYESALG